MKKILAALLAVLMLIGLCSAGMAEMDTTDKNVVIWTTEEEHVVEYYINALKEKFPEYRITIENVSSSTMPAKEADFLSGTKPSVTVGWSR